MYYLLLRLFKKDLNLARPSEHMPHGLSAITKTFFVSVFFIYMEKWMTPINAEREKE